MSPSPIIFWPKHEVYRGRPAATVMALTFRNGTFLFMIRDPTTDTWSPDKHMLHIYRTAIPPPRVYKLADTDEYISVDNNGVERRWGLLFRSAAHITELAEDPWISNDDIYLEFPAADITAFDAWIRDRCAGPWRTEWEDHLRPQVEGTPRPPFVFYTVAPPPSAPPQPLPPLPAHVAAMIIARAVESGATCPITMEPIQAATATTTPCGHVFEATALRTWLRTHDTCPECRAPIAHV